VRLGALKFTLRHFFAPLSLIHPYHNRYPLPLLRRPDPESAKK
jgi:hypothetical protein